MKKSQAIFTMVKNERYFLPIWLKYYRQFFPASDTYVLDNGTTDGSTTGIDATVLPMESQYAFDVQWLLDTVKAFQRTLLEQYDVVVFAEADEIIVPNQPGDFKAHVMERPVARCVGYEVMHLPDIEAPIDWSKPLMPQRNFWLFRYDFSKPLVATAPIDWEFGFHDCAPSVAIDKSLMLIHLRRVDYEHSKWRLQDRAQWERNPIQQANHAWQWKISPAEFDGWYFWKRDQLKLIGDKYRNVC